MSRRHLSRLVAVKPDASLNRSRAYHLAERLREALLWLEDHVIKLEDGYENDAPAVVEDALFRLASRLSDELIEELEKTADGEVIE